MAALSNIKIEMELRPCFVRSLERTDNRKLITNTRKALFHKWAEKSEIVPPSYLKGGHGGGVVRGVVAIVEYEDGTVGEVLPENIRFLDSPHDQYGFTEREARE